MKKLLLLTIIISYGFWSCKDGGGSDDKPTPKTLCDSVTYNTMVKPIFTASCATSYCHLTGTGGVYLNTYSKSKEAAQTKEMIKAINHQLDANRNMPKGGSKLSQRNIDIIECWVSKGCPE